jgi:hypothetical protein
LKRLWLIVSLVLATAAVSVPLADGAAPRILIVSGEPLAHQVVISNWTTIFKGIVEPVMQTPTVNRRQLRGRPHLTLSMFWGPRWNDYLATGRPAAALRPGDADQQGSFYPAWHGRTAAIDLPWAGSWPRRVPPRALTTLKSYRIPIALD